MPPQTTPRAPLLLGVLLAINFLNFADRYVTAGVQELIKHDPGFLGGARDGGGLLTDASLGTLTSAFVVVFMLASPVTGYLGDRVPRKYLVAGGVLVWSFATIASGLATSYGSLLAARALIGAGEAGYATVAPALIADLFDRGRRGRALGAFYAMIPLGAAAGFGIGSSVGVAYGWRTAFYVAGLPGLVLGVVALVLREPVRGAFDVEKPAGSLSPLACARALFTNRPFVLNCAGQTLMTFTIGGLATWMPTFLSRSVGMPLAKAGLIFGIITAVAGVVGTVAGAWGGEVLAKRHRQGYFLLSGTVLVLAAPMIVLVAAGLGEGPTIAFAFAALALILANQGPLGTHLVNAVPPTLRASAVAANILMIHLLGDAISPPLIGEVSDLTGSLAFAVALCAVPVLAGGVVLLLSARNPAAEPLPTAPEAG